VNFLFDNNLPPDLAKALRLLQKRTAHVREIEDLGASAPDDLILDYAARWDYSIVSRDRAMTRTPHYRALVNAKSARVYLMHTGSARHLNAWQIAQMTVRAWDNIERYAVENAPPFLTLVQQNGRVTSYRYGR
jgi:predicted nuclease of predicted toxin-antitoxin system